MSLVDHVMPILDELELLLSPRSHFSAHRLARTIDRSTQCRGTRFSELDFEIGD